MNTMKKTQQGFTLIELMIVVAIIGILAALAIPAYQDYTIKARVAEGASLSGTYKTAIDLYWSENGTLAGIGGGGTTLGLTSASGQYVSAVTIEGSRNVEVTLKADPKLGDAGGACFQYKPTAASASGGNLIWESSEDCSGTDLPAKYLPRS